MVCRLWDVASGELRRELKGHAAKTPSQPLGSGSMANFSTENDGRTTAPNTKISAVASTVYS